MFFKGGDQLEAEMHEEVYVVKEHTQDESHEWKAEERLIHGIFANSEKSA